MANKIFRSTYFVTILSVIISIITVSSILCYYFNNQTSNGMKEEIEYLVKGMEAGSNDYLDEIAIKDVRVTWIASDGEVLFDSEANVNDMENHKERKEVKDALDKGEGEDVRYSKTLSVRTIYQAQRLKDGSVIRIAKEQKTLLSLFGSMLQPLAILLVCIITFSYLISDKLAKRIVAPINEIDLEKGSMTEDYEEIVPLLHRIRAQNKLIQKQMEQLQTKQAEFTAITENMKEGFLIVDNSLQVLSYNTSAMELLAGQEWNRSDSRNVLALNRSQNFRRAVEESLSGYNSNQSMIFKDRFYRIVANPVYEKKEISGCVIVILDETEKEEREALRREFSANVSHELKTPLTSISGIAEIIENGIVKQEDIPNFARNIREEAARLIGLINDIIYLSKLEETGEMAEKEEIELVTLLTAIKDRLHMPMEEKNIKWTLEGSHGVICGVPSMIEEMLYNICDNAIKYNKENGEIHVKVAQEEENGEKHVVVSVEDTGIGVSQEDYERIFERFYRVDKSHSKEIGGTGLGLSIVKHIAGYHNAKIQMDSELGKGTKITIKF